jgi:hypothetical protein
MSFKQTPFTSRKSVPGSNPEQMASNLSITHIFASNSVYLQTSITNKNEHKLGTAGSHENGNGREEYHKRDDIPILERKDIQISVL